tara:strand:- start:508 stop:732 length:225 start_codon:yes stop_codon:yes gene_type:complete
MITTNKLNLTQIKQRAFDKLYAKMFFSKQRIEEYIAVLKGDLFSKVDNDITLKMLESERNNLETLEFINNQLKK